MMNSKRPSTQSHPKVSIISGVYNGAPYLRESVRSILNQTLTDFEFIIVDDGSSDGSSEILAEFDDPRIVCLRNPSNLGLPKTFNRALEVSRGEFLARHDADDISLPFRLEKQVEYMETHPEVGVLGCQMRVENQYEELLYVYRLPCAHSMIAWNLFFGRSIAHPTVMIRRSLLERLGGYDPGFPFAEDFELWTRLVPNTRAANMPEALYVYRDRADSVSHIRAADQLHFYVEARRRLAERILDRQVSRDLIEWLNQSQTLEDSLTYEQIEQVIQLILEIRHAMERKGLLEDEGLQEVRKDMVARVANTIHCSHDTMEQTRPAYETPPGLLARLLRVVTNPRRALLVGPKWFMRGIKRLIR